jgi:predicted Ser/Thr protein kinase
MPAPSAIGPYKIDRLLAVGGQSKVYLGEGRHGPVAVKVARQREYRPQLVKEAGLLDRCAHPHLVRLDGASPDGTWLALEALEGPDIATWSTGRSVDEIVGAALELLEAVRHLHARKVCHGDLKPANVLMVDWGHPKLLDLASAFHDDQARTRGTPGFAAPEVLSGESAGPPSDLYSFGATLYACLTQRAPFHDADPTALPLLTRTSSPLPPSAFRVDIPSRLDRLVMRLLSRNPLGRPELREIVRSLTRLHRSEPARPMVGMTRTRATLRSLVAEAADGVPTTVVLYGPDGCGRRTLVEEAARQARNEGMRPMLKSRSRDFLRAVLDGLRPVSAVRASSRNTLELARRVFAADQPALLLVVSNKPVPELVRLGATHIAPEPLSLDAAKLLAEWLQAPASAAERAWASVDGHPRRLWAALHAEGKAHTDDPKATKIPQQAMRVLDALRRRHGSASVQQLVRETRIEPGAVIDACELLITADLAATDTSGRRFSATDA